MAQAQTQLVKHQPYLAVHAGIAVASACAFILKRFQLTPGADSRQGGPAFNATIYEVALVVMSAYLAYLVSETLALSGIVTLFFTGICHAHYSYYSVTKEAAITLKRLFEFAALLSEMFVFAYLGLQVSLQLDDVQLDITLRPCAFVLILDDHVQFSSHLPVLHTCPFACSARKHPTVRACSMHLLMQSFSAQRPCTFRMNHLYT